MIPDTPWPDSPHRPPLDARQCAMLAEMGVNVWWQPPPPERTAPDAAVATARAAALARPTAPPATAPAPRVAAPAPVPARPAAPATVVPIHPEPAPASDLATLEAAIATCSRCELAQRRQHAVPGMGDPSPDWLIVGEAPGEEEDRQGLPFVGRAGQLLDRMLAAMALTRQQRVYIANVIKCRPPQNRNPSPVEIEQCTPFLLRQVQLLRPRIVLAMGRFAAHTVLGQGGRFDPAAVAQMPLGKLRGQVHRVQLGGVDLPVVVTYHPAYLLRNPADKAKAWADLCLAMDTLAALGERR